MPSTLEPDAAAAPSLRGVMAEARRREPVGTSIGSPVLLVLG